MNTPSITLSSIANRFATPQSSNANRVAPMADGKSSPPAEKAIRVNGRGVQLGDGRWVPSSAATQQAAGIKYVGVGAYGSVVQKKLLDYIHPIALTNAIVSGAAKATATTVRRIEAALDQVVDMSKDKPQIGAAAGKVVQCLAISQRDTELSARPMARTQFLVPSLPVGTAESLKNWDAEGAWNLACARENAVGALLEKKPNMDPALAIKLVSLIDASVFTNPTQLTSALKTIGEAFRMADAAAMGAKPDELIAYLKSKEGAARQRYVGACLNQTIVNRIAKQGKEREAKDFADRQTVSTETFVVKTFAALQWAFGMAVEAPHESIVGAVRNFTEVLEAQHEQQQQGTAAASSSQSRTQVTVHESHK